MWQNNTRTSTKQNFPNNKSRRSKFLQVGATHRPPFPVALAQWTNKITRRRCRAHEFVA